MVEIENLILNGGFPPQEPWISEAISARDARGLKTSREQAIELLKSADAQDQYRRYGVLVTPTEEESFAAESSYNASLSEIAPELARVEGVGELQADTKTRPWTLTLWAHRSADLNSIDRKAQELGARLNGLRLQVRQSKLDPVDVEEAARVWRGTAPADELFPDPAARGAIKSQGKPTEMIADYVHGRVLLGYQPGPGRQAGQKMVTGSGVEVEIYHAADSDDIDPICGRAYCGAPRSGSYIERPNTAACSLGPAILLSNFSTNTRSTYMTTAGHCGDPTTALTSYKTARQRFYNVSQDVFYEWGTPSTHTYPYLSGTIASELANTLEGGGSFSLADGLIMSGFREFAPGLITSHSGPSLRQVGWGVAAVDVPVCISGYKTQTCGTINHTNVTHFITDHGWSREVQNLARATYTGIPGDSGGVIFSGGYVYGLHQGGDSGNERFTKVNYVTPSNYYGFDIYKPTNGRSHYVSNLYWRVLNREPDASGYNYWMSVLHPSSLDPCSPAKAATVADSFLLSSEFKGNVPLVGGSALPERIRIRVRMAYRTALGREPDLDSMAYWYGYVVAGSTEADRESRWVTVFHSIAASVEFNNRVISGGASVEGPVCN